MGHRSLLGFSASPLLEEIFRANASRVALPLEANDIPGKWPGFLLFDNRVVRARLFFTGGSNLETFPFRNERDKPSVCMTSARKGWRRAAIQLESLILAQNERWRRA